MDTVKLRKIMRRLIAGIGLLMFLLPQGAWADPSPGVRWLQNNPVSLFDFGIFKLERYLDDPRINYLDSELGKIVTTPKIQIGGGGHSVKYQFQSNKLVIYFMTVSLAKEDSQGDQCKKSVDGLRKTILWDKAPKESMAHGYGKESGQKVLNSFFSHEGYFLKSRPNNLAEELIAITYIQVTQYGLKELKAISCEMLLAGGPISITKKQ